MGPYSHFILAARLEKHLHPKPVEDYYWGAIIPDIRYLAQMRRDQTHLEQENLAQLSGRYPHLKSFLLGYRVHCLIDKIDVLRLVNSSFPLNVLSRVMRKKFSQQQMTMLVEMYYLQSAAISKQMTGNHNEILNDLGIQPDQTCVFFEAMQTYIDSRSVDGAISAFQKIGMIENTRLEKYFDTYRAMKKRKLINGMIMLGVRNARLDQHVMHFVQSSIPHDISPA